TRREHGIHTTKVPAIDAAADHSREQLVGGLHDLSTVELGEIGEVVQLPGHEPEDRLEFRRTNEVPVCAEVALERIDRVAFARLGGCLTEAVHDDGPDDLAEELFLVGEVEVDG